MNIKIVLIILLLIITLFLAACNQSSTVIAEAPNETIVKQIQEEQLCANVTCEQNQQCLAGSCACAPSFKQCNKECIPNSACCSNQDCETGKFCDEKNKCSKNSIMCRYNKVWDKETEFCICSQGTKFCEQQDKCIPEKNCCVPSDCTLRRDVCVPTNYAASMCINDSALHCKTVFEGQQALFSLQDNTFKIAVTDILQEGNAQIKLNNEDKSMIFQRQETIADKTTLFVEEIKTLGGTCKTYNN